MITRTVRAESMMLALAQVKNELGVDALVVSARQVPGGSPWQVWRKPMVEVVAVRLEPGEDTTMVGKQDSNEAGFPVDKHSSVKDLTRKDTVIPKQGNLGGSSKKKSGQQQTPAQAMSDPAGQAEKVSPPQLENTLSNTQPVDVVEIQGKKGGNLTASNPKFDLLQQLAREEVPEDLSILQVATGTKTALPALQLPNLPWNPPQEAPKKLQGAWPLLEKLYSQLLHQGVETGLIQKICQVTADTLGYEAASDETRVMDHLRRQFEAYIKVQREFSPKERQVICVIGPSGAGKTSFCAKLAIRYRQVLKRSVAWVCADTIRTGGIAEAKSYTEAINIPLKVVFTPQELFDAIEYFSNQDLVIVDTPACNPLNEESLVEIGALLTAIPNRITWIVVPATAKENDLVNTVAALNSFNPKALVVTKLDETNSFGSIYNLAFRSQLPFSYFTRGARILDDLIPAAASRLVQAFFTERFD